MEAQPAGVLPNADSWRYEPKWNGFRAIASRAGDAIELLSKSGESRALIS